MGAYQLTGGSLIVRESDGAFIPADPRNADYRTYLQWVAAGNVPDPPPAPAPAQVGQAAYNAAIAAGCQIVSTGTPALNGTYALDDASLLKLVGEQNYIQLKSTFTNGQATRAWLDAAGAPHIFPSTSAFTSFAEALGAYIDALQTALAAALAGGAWIAPAQPVAIP
jgi:hypothetical protein